MSRDLVILDRDGVINHDSEGFIKSVDEWRAIDGSIGAIGRLTNAGFSVATATNQSGLGRGLLDLDMLHKIHQEMRTEVLRGGGVIEDIVYCPHLPLEDCACRKPLPGMLFDIGRRLGFALEGVPFIGDSLRDIDAAVAAGARPMLVLTGNGKDTAAVLADAGRTVETFSNLGEAAAFLVSAKERRL